MLLQESNQRWGVFPITLHPILFYFYNGDKQATTCILFNPSDKQM